MPFLYPPYDAESALPDSSFEHDLDDLRAACHEVLHLCDDSTWDLRRRARVGSEILENVSDKISSRRSEKIRNINLGRRAAELTRIAAGREDLQDG